MAQGGTGGPTGGATGNNFNFDQIQSTFGQKANELDIELKNKISTMDPNSTKDMVAFQVDFNKYMIIEGLRSSIIKSIKDTIQSIIQKL
ncbi:EscF/YscF/HrpA family type III secretion system needle major subunit [Endozoicomonas gorgoniicola]|uniref:EscF/YscF/HrpA family type III secretion system needle major subunit n=1 Tax=Endozoicomonas gorgoniicola TaxID=1234144 RepID=A0ABT3MRB9_9GAMM|nr:EscF/YscF/HrpA family type III secretion system needle major subunit [Endozoicomonas gorgoniicola]MCW7551917.1 EscF/YscF/HrpA family type III secretion system needle major subunit [Endozoicomonas gorgoniicola]